MKNTEATPTTNIQEGSTGASLSRRKFSTLMGVGIGGLVLGNPEALSFAEPASHETLVIKTRFATFAINRAGAISAIDGDGRDCLSHARPAPVLCVRVGGQLHAANRATWVAARNFLKLGFEGIGTTAIVAVRTKPSHVTFELSELHNAPQIELVLWGPYPIAIRDLVGEVVGVVRDSRIAVGIQALNVKTLGGFPSNEDDVEPDQSLADDPGSYPGLPVELRKEQLWRGNTATLTEYGSSLQAYCRSRDHQRVIKNRGQQKFVAPAFSDGGVIGSKIALFATSASEALATLGEIEVVEGLPHPMLGGTWAKMARAATASYLIVDFGEDTIDLAIEMTQQRA